MAVMSDPRLHLFASLSDPVGTHLGASNDVEPMLPGLDLVPAPRRHITILDLNVRDIPQDHVAQLIGWVMATMPPYAFRVAFDQIVTAARSTLLKASEPLVGALECQAHVIEMARHYGLDLPRQAAPVPHVTLGYGRRDAGNGGGGVQPIDGVSWLVEELVLVRSLHGRGIHQPLGRWRLPRRSRVAA
jgi:2'-5' RNA ligase